MKLSLIVLLICFHFPSTFQSAVKLIRNGRPFHGFLPPMDLGEKDRELKYDDDSAAGHYFIQPLDHTNDSHQVVAWRQRYWENSAYYEPGGPVFLFIEGEAPASYEPIRTGAHYTVNKLARTFHAKLYDVEHRYYGKSQPTSDQSSANLKYLSSEQALADLANFIETKRSFPNETWIAFGGSYSGNLAAWLREKYPDLVAGSIASSAPVKAQVDFYGYFKVVEESLRANSDSCAENVRKAIVQLQSTFKTDVGKKQLESKEMYHTCGPVSNKIKDIQTFYSDVIGPFALASQYGGINARNYATEISIPSVCKIMNDNTTDVLKRLVTVYRTMYAAMDVDVSSDNGCMDTNYTRQMKQISDTSFDSPLSSIKSWLYQTCTEFGYYTTTVMPDKNGIFGNIVPVNHSTDSCVDIFGPSFDLISINNAVQKTNAYYGEVKNFKGTNVVLPNGSQDPWHWLGILNSTIASSPSILVTGSAHCADMFPAMKGEPTGLAAARTLVADNIRRIIDSRKPVLPTTTSPVLLTTPSAAHQFKPIFCPLLVTSLLSVLTYY